MTFGAAHFGTLVAIGWALTACTASSDHPAEEAGGAAGAGGSAASAGASGAVADAAPGGSGGTANQCDTASGCSYRVDSASGRVTTTLECFCANAAGTRGCPATLDEATATALPSLPCLGETDGYAFVDRGCGVVTVGFDGLWGILWHYDEATGALIGAERWDDIPNGPCNASDYAGGVSPSCDSKERCTTCTGITQSGQPVPACSF